MRASYDALDPAMKEKIAGLSCAHSVWYSRCLAGAKMEDFRPDELAGMPGAVQPLVRVHSGSGRKSLVLASHASHIIGWPVEEGRALLKELTQFATQDRFVYAHHWELGELVIWDNRCTMHRGSIYDDKRYRRDMRRTTVQLPQRASSPAA
jgi:alpha-ketoglutarate-dependent 2,4-dichlorophenoxyacetate dioxygenase